MVDILISVKADLASSIAIRYAGQLGELVNIALQPIHVKEPDQKGNLFGTGWVRHTWEHALAEKGEEEINLLIKTERRYCPVLAAPRVVVGDREAELLRELQSGAYDLFMEGVLASFNEADFRKLIRSKLYQNAPCPIIVVKNLVGLEKVALFIQQGTNPNHLVDQFVGVLGKAGFSLDLVYYSSVDGSTDLQVNQDGGEVMELNETRRVLEAKGQRTGDCVVVSGPPRKVGEYLSVYGLVACPIKDEIQRKGPASAVLAHTPSPLFIC